MEAKHSFKVCSLCGKKEGAHWKRHWENQHPRQEPSQLAQGAEPQVPWCSNWRSVIQDRAAPINIHPTFDKGFKRENKLWSKRAKTAANQSVLDLSEWNQGLEEEKEELLLREQQQKQLQDKFDFLVKDDHIMEEASHLQTMKTGSVLGKRLLAAAQASGNEAQTGFKVIQKLRYLEQSRYSNSIRLARLVKVIQEVLHDDDAATFIEEHHSEFETLKELTFLGLQQCEHLMSSQTAGVLYLSVLFGGRHWLQLPVAMNKLPLEVVKEILTLLEGPLSRKFGPQIFYWISRNCDQITAITLETLRLIKYLTAHPEQQEQKLLQLSLVVELQHELDFENFMLVTKLFFQYPASKFLLDKVANSSQIQVKLSFIEYQQLLTQLSLDSNQLLLVSNEDMLRQIPIHGWLSRLESQLQARYFNDGQSLEKHLSLLVQQFGVLKHKLDVQIENDQRFERTFHEAEAFPSNWQLALSQYAALKLMEFPRQLLSVGSGQGKSRIAATIALILLLSGCSKKVYMVYDSAALMERDQKEFKKYWTLNSLEQRVIYRVGLDSNFERESTIIIDEADQLIFESPSLFDKRTSNRNCICLTATPDNADANGIESEVLSLLGFKVFEGSSKGVAPQFNMTLSQELFPYIEKERLSTPVIVFCSSALLLQQLQQAGQTFKVMSQESRLEDAYLRQLDQVKDGSLYPLIVVPSLFAMRGFDYRAPTTGITLIVAASFPNQRQLWQGLNRVGRYGDLSRRVLLNGIAPVDKETEFKYKAVLMKFCSEKQQKKLCLKQNPTPASKQQKKWPLVQGQQGIDKYMSKRQKEDLIKKS